MSTAYRTCRASLQINFFFYLLLGAAPPTDGGTLDGLLVFLWPDSIETPCSQIINDVRVFNGLSYSHAPLPFTLRSSHPKLRFDKSLQWYRKIKEPFFSKFRSAGLALLYRSTFSWCFILMNFLPSHHWWSSSGDSIALSLHLCSI